MIQELRGRETRARARMDHGDVHVLNEEEKRREAGTARDDRTRGKAYADQNGRNATDAKSSAGPEPRSGPIGGGGSGSGGGNKRHPQVLPKSYISAISPSLSLSSPLFPPRLPPFVARYFYCIIKPTS